MRAVPRALRTAAKDTVEGLIVVSHNTLALVGLSVLALAAVVLSQESLRHDLEARAFGFLHARYAARADAAGDVLHAVTEPQAIDRATAINPKELSKQQAAVTDWLARRYKVAQEPVARLVQEAWSMGERAKLEPTLILAIIAIESSFNPFAQSPVGAQGLMQVMTRVHDDKYEPFGGNHAAFDPVTNLRVGVQVLKECIQRAGSVEAGLRHYVGAANLEGDGGYAARVMFEHEQLRAVLAGRRPPVSISRPQPAPAAPREPIRLEASEPAAATEDAQVALLSPAPPGSRR